LDVVARVRGEVAALERAVAREHPHGAGLVVDIAALVGDVDVAVGSGGHGFEEVVDGAREGTRELAGKVIAADLVVRAAHEDVALRGDGDEVGGGEVAGVGPSALEGVAVGGAVLAGVVGSPAMSRDGAASASATGAASGATASASAVVVVAARRVRKCMWFPLRDNPARAVQMGGRGRQVSSPGLGVGRQ